MPRPRLVKLSAVAATAATVMMRSWSAALSRPFSLWRFLAVVATPDSFGGCDGAPGTGCVAAGREAGAVRAADRAGVQPGGVPARRDQPADRETVATRPHGHRRGRPEAALCSCDHAGGCGSGCRFRTVTCRRTTGCRSPTCERRGPGCGRSRSGRAAAYAGTVALARRTVSPDQGVPAPYPREPLALSPGQPGVPPFPYRRGEGSSPRVGLAGPLRGGSVVTDRCSRCRVGPYRDIVAGRRRSSSPSCCCEAGVCTYSGSSGLCGSGTTPRR